MSGQRYCPYCGESHSADAKFCASCGKAFSASPADQQGITRESTGQKRQRDKKLWKITGVLCAIIAAIIGLAVLGMDLKPIKDRAACQPEAVQIPVRWSSFEGHDTVLVTHSNDWAGWDDGEVCVKGRVRWDRAFGDKLTLTFRAFYPSSRSSRARSPLAGWASFRRGRVPVRR